MKRNCSKMILVLLAFCFACYSSSWATPLHKYSIKHLTLGGTWSTAIAINELGQVIGTSQISGDASFHGFIYYRGTITDIGSIYPYNINNLGQVVGHYNTEINGDSTLVLFLLTPGHSPGQMVLTISAKWLVRVILCMLAHNFMLTFTATA